MQVHSLYRANDGYLVKIGIQEGFWDDWVSHGKKTVGSLSLLELSLRLGTLFGYYTRAMSYIKNEVRSLTVTLLEEPLIATSLEK